ncbi:unnamed protein product [Rotaria sp. Silwood2]|nr:unnamed protein product [Rotaria sp. Silwood2]CAF4079179.1 unnamed protein product [Rotaria sp. Silwood2]
MTDHCPLCYIMKKTIKNARVNRLTHLIQEYNIDKVVHIRGRYNCLPDYLSRYSKEQDDELNDIEYGLGSKNHSILSFLKPSANNSKSHSLESSDNQNILAAMTLRPRKNQTKITNDTRDSDSGTASHQGFDIVSRRRDIKKRKVASNISQNYFDTTKLKIEQKRDPDIQNIVRSLNLKSNQLSFVLKDDIVYKLIKLNKHSNNQTEVIYLPSSMINSLLRACHDDPMSGAHFSTNRLYYKVRNHFWWPRMKSTIEHYVKACRLCKQFNISRNKRFGYLRSISPSEGPFALISMDYCEPLSRTPRENQYVLVITDYFTRYVTAIALPNCTAETTAQALFNEYFCKYGIPSVVLSDRESHFQNKLMENLQKLIRYNHIYSTPYHPQTNGVVERFNATFVTQVSKLQDTQL